jgi:type I restriction enzyme M protein
LLHTILEIFFITDLTREGTAGFLIGAADYLRDHHNNFLYNTEQTNHYHNTMFHGYDMDTTMLRIGAMNMMLHQVENPQISYQDSLSEENTEREKYSLILANPPFTGSLDYEIVANDIIASIKTKKTELLFVDLIIKMLKTGGRAAIIVPDGVLFGSSRAHKTLRKTIVEENKLDAVISMPSGVFKPYAGVSTAVLVFTKTGMGGTDNVWFYDMENDGFTLNDNRTEIEENDIPDIIERYNNLEAEKDRARTEKSFMVPKSEIAEKDYDLSINKYKEIVYEAIEYDEPQVIIARIQSMEDEIQAGLYSLKELLGD